jgi:hypothetical protein
MLAIAAIAATRASTIATMTRVLIPATWFATSLLIVGICAVWLLIALTSVWSVPTAVWMVATLPLMDEIDPGRVPTVVWTDTTLPSILVIIGWIAVMPVLTVPRSV